MAEPARNGDAPAHITRRGAQLEGTRSDPAGFAGCASLLGIGTQEDEASRRVALSLLDAALDEELLTPAQHVVASLMCLGANNHLISDFRQSSPRTVGGQLTEIFKSAGVVEGRAEYIARILRRVLLTAARRLAQLEQQRSNVGASQNGARSAR